LAERTNGEYDKLPIVALKACTAVVHDPNETAHAIDVTAESLYEAIAQALAALRGHDWSARSEQDRPPLP